MRTAVLIAVVLAFAAPALSAPTRTTADFDLADVCPFPIRVHVDGMFVSGPGGFHENTTYTLSNSANGLSLTQKSTRTDRFSPERDGGWTSYTTGVVRITIPGQGVVYQNAGRVAYHYDSNGQFVSREVIGGQDDLYSTYTARVCGYLAGS